MANIVKYKFKVYLQNGETETIIPNEMKDTKLEDLDRFSIEKGGFLGLCEILGKELSMNPHKIDKITILQLKTGMEFSLISNNQYISAVLSSLQTKKVQRYGNYFIDATIISNNHSSYLEMKDYVFKNLHSNHLKFLNEIYHYQNSFHKLLYQYANAYQQGIYSEEEERNIKELERKITSELSIYQNYRGLSSARKRWEEMVNRQSQNKYNQKNTTHLQVTSSVTTSPYIMYHVTEENLKNVTITFNQEYEEFLEPEEYEKMLGEDSSNSKYRY